MNQAPSSIFMVRPNNFGYNHETAKSNTFQKEVLICDNHNITKNARREFEDFVDILRKHGIEVLVFDSPLGKNAPDAVFPNNWVSFHEDGTVILYPMLTENRRIERRKEVIDEIGKYFQIHRIIDLSPEERNGKILEGTGSIVFDHINRVAYANESARTNKNLFYDVCLRLGYEGVFFKAVDEQGKDIYHTNVLMTIGDGFAVICTECIDKADVVSVTNTMHAGGLELVEISYKQLNYFAGNMIQLKNNMGKNFLVISDSAYKSLHVDQIDLFSKYVEIIHADIETIESVGGGSVRCMIAGIHLQPK